MLARMWMEKLAARQHPHGCECAACRKAGSCQCPECRQNDKTMGARIHRSANQNAAMQMQEASVGIGKSKQAGLFDRAAEKMLHRHAPVPGWRTMLGAFGGTALGTAGGGAAGVAHGLHLSERATAQGRHWAGLGHAAITAPLEGIYGGAIGGAGGAVLGTGAGLAADIHASAAHSARIRTLAGRLRMGAGAGAGITGALGLAAYAHGRRTAN